MFHGDLKTKTLPEILAALPSTRTTVEDQPMVWRHPASGYLLADGRLLTGQQAVAEAQAVWPEVADFRLAGPVLVWTNRIGAEMTYVADHPMPADPDKAAGDLESDLLSLGFSDELAAHLVHAVRTAVGGADPGPELRQFLAAWSRPRTYTAPDFTYPDTELEI